MSRTAGLGIGLLLLLVPSASGDESPDDVLVRVDGEPITRADLEFEFVTSGVPVEKRDELRRTYLEGLVDSRLLEAFLRSRKVEADERAIEDQIARIRRMMERREQDPDRVLAEIGYDASTLRSRLALPIAWDAYVHDVVRPAQVRAYWEKHRARFDGTRLRARQILLRIPADADDARVEEAIATLNGIRADVTADETSFEVAAEKHSDAPSATRGGDVGWFPYRGKMPVSFTENAFDLEPGEVGEPFRSPFGVHLVQVTDRRPGEYSLEDVRVFVFNALAREVRQRLIDQRRETAEIEWLPGSD